MCSNADKSSVIIKKKLYEPNILDTVNQNWYRKKNSYEINEI